ncbi:MAG: CotH kinase family protein [Acidobacteria bacterium]|nr:CotH kinase family protein [Acidobacteriota bacterium]
MKRSALLLASFAILFAEPPSKTADLFQTGKLWTIHLKFAADQWASIEPKGGARPMMGGPGFGIGNIIVPAFLKADADGDRVLTAAEFTALANTWFTQWDKKKSGALDRDDLRAGTASIFESAIGQFMGGRGPGGPGGMVAPKGKRNGLSGMAGIDFEYVHADLDFDGRTLPNVAVRYKGNGTYMQSRGREKKSFKIDLNEYNKDQNLAGITKFNLHCNVTDASWMNEVLSYRLYRDAGLVAPRTAYARVYVTVPGKFDRKYFGLYSIVEEIDSAFAESNYGTKDGLFLKPATRDVFGYLGDKWDAYEQPYDPKGKPTAAQKNRVMDFTRLVSNGTPEDFNAHAAEFLNIPQIAKYMAVTTWLSTLDSILGMGQNYYVYLNAKTNKFDLLPWDLDHSFGQFPMGGSQEQRETLSILRPWQGQIRFLERLYALPEFRTAYLAQMAEYQKTIFTPERFARQVDDLAKVLRPAVAEETGSRLERFEKAVAGDVIAPEMSGIGIAPRPGAPGPNFPGVKPIKGFVVPRSQSVRDQLAGKSEGTVRGGGGFFGPGGGPGGPQFRGPSFEPQFLEQMDADKNGSVTSGEFRAGFAKWFESWNTDKSGKLTEAQLREGINRDLNPMRGTMPPPPPR